MTNASVLRLIFGACACEKVWSCCGDVDSYGGAILWCLIMVYMFKALAVVCDDYFVPSLEGISEALDLSEDVAGATFMAAGSSAPELFTSLVATFFIVNEGGVGTIIGSAIFNILVIVGATSAFCGKELSIWWYPLTRDCVFYCIAILELGYCTWDEVVEWYEGLLMVISYFVYLLYMKFNGTIVKRLGLEQPADVESADVEASTLADNGGACDEEAGEQELTEAASGPQKSLECPQEEVVQQPGETTQEPPEPTDDKSLASTAPPPVAAEPLPSHSDRSDDPETSKDHEIEAEKTSFCRDPLLLALEMCMPPPERYWLLFGLSILVISISTYLMVDATIRIGCTMTIPPFLMGTVFLAAGTSVPDALGSIKVAKEGQGDMAIANALGSNIFDVMLCLGVPWTIKAGIMGKEVSFPGAQEEFRRYGVFLVLALALFVSSLVISRWRLNKYVGAFLLVVYVVYVVYSLTTGIEGSSDAKCGSSEWYLLKGSD